MSLFDYDEEGHSIVIADGAEVLVYDGATEAPRWRRDTGQRLVGVASNAISILSLDDVGVLKVWSHETATEVRRIQLGVPATALVSDFEGRSGAVHSGGVITAVGGQPREHAVPGATAAAFGGDGQLLVGTGDGALHRFDADGSPTGTAQVPGPVHDVAWNPGGFFMVANGGAVHRLDDLEVSHVTNAPDGQPVRSIACSAAGDRVGLHVGDHLAVVLAYPSRETEGHAQYGDRRISGVAFGPSNWFGVGLDLGDGNKFDLVTGATHRTDTHPGRPHNRWILMAAFGAPEPAPAARPPAPTAAPVIPPSAGGSSDWMLWAGVAVVLFVVTAFFVALS